MPKSNRDNELDKMYKELLETRKSVNSVSSKSEGSRLLSFFVGLLLLGGGLFMIFQNIEVTSSWGYGGHIFSFGGFHLANGLIMLPIIIGIAMLFLMDKKIYGWIVLSIGIVIVLLTGNVDFTSLAFQIGEGEGAAVLKYGTFIQNVVDFVIVAFCIFLMLKGINKLNRKKEEPAPEPEAPKGPTQEELLAEIRDLLMK